MVKTMSKAQFERIARALSEPRRVAILKEVGGWQNPLPCNTLLDAQNISAPTLSFHIKELENAGLLQVEKSGKFSYLSLNRELLREYADRLVRL